MMLGLVPNIAGAMAMLILDRVLPNAFRRMLMSVGVRARPGKQFRCNASTLLVGVSEVSLEGLVELLLESELL